MSFTTFVIALLNDKITWIDFVTTESQFIMVFQLLIIADLTAVNYLDLHCSLLMQMQHAIIQTSSKLALCDCLSDETELVSSAL